MSRPLYENSNDLSNELAVMQHVSEIARMSYRKLPIRYHVDYALIKDSAIYAWIEVKCRKNPKDQYPTLMISAAKLMSGLEMSTHTGRPFYLVVKWIDGIGRIKIDDLKKYKLGFGGRADRNDNQDMEPVYEIPIKDFLIIKAA